MISLLIILLSPEPRDACSPSPIAPCIGFTNAMAELNQLPMVAALVWKASLVSSTALFVTSRMVSAAVGGGGPLIFMLARIGGSNAGGYAVMPEGPEKLFVAADVETGNPGASPTELLSLLEVLAPPSEQLSLEKVDSDKASGCWVGVPGGEKSSVWLEVLQALG
jgi:hypothetical protein